LGFDRCLWGTSLIERHPNARFIIDHLAILQPRTPPVPPQPWTDLPKVLDLAKHKNAVIKVSGACTLFPRIVSVPGHRLDTRIRRRQLRAGRRAIPQD
jgi:hypothetical protein